MMISIVAKLISRCGDNEIMISRLANMIKRGGDDNDMISRVALMIRRGVFFINGSDDQQGGEEAWSKMISRGVIMMISREAGTGRAGAGGRLPMGRKHSTVMGRAAGARCC